MKSPHRMLFAFIILFVAIACLCPVTTPTPTAPPTIAPAPTNEPAPNDDPAPTANVPQPPSNDTPPSNGNLQFFTEEFDTSLSNAWSILTVTGSDKADPDKVTVEPQNGRLVWDFESEYVYYYLFYQGSTYTDVKVEVRADNRGKNNNSISLICRYDPEVGWYEFNIANNGLYDIYYAEITSDGSIGYNRIINGGSNDINIGKDVNEYSISCSGDKLSLVINGKEVNTITEKKYGLREGGVGVSVSAFNVLPILVEMDWFKVSEP